MIWQSSNFDKMDTIEKRGDLVIITDYGLPITRPIPTPITNATKRQTLNLEELIQDKEKEHPVMNHQLDLMVDDDFFQQIFTFHETDVLRQDFENIQDVEEETSRWLQQRGNLLPETWDPEDAESLFIYTDGSFHPKTEEMAWAFAVIVLQDDQYFLLGFRGAAVTITPTHQHFVGTKYAGSMQAEVEALYWASFWLCRFAIATAWRGKVTFRWDSQTAGAKASSLATVDNWQAQGPTARRLRGLQQLLDTLMNEPVAHEHVYAHRGEVFNELVDAISKTAARERWQNNNEGPSVDIIESTCPQAFDVMWFHYLDKTEDIRWPDYDNGLLQWSTSTTPFRPSPQTSQMIKESMMGPAVQKCTVEHTIQYELHLASYNAMTLDQTKGPSLHADQGRAGLLRRAVHEAKIHVLAIQEARTQRGAIHSASHFRFSSGKESSGQGGIEIWFSRLHPFGWNEEDKSYFFQEHAFHVDHASATILVVSYKTDELKVTFIGAHAPHEGHPGHEKDDWWRQLREISHEANLQNDIVILCDANARLGTTEDAAVGGLSDDIENDNGQRLRVHLHDFQLWAPATFRGIHFGQNHTWEHPMAIAEQDLTTCSSHRHGGSLKPSQRPMQRSQLDLQCLITPASLFR